MILFGVLRVKVAPVLFFMMIFACGLPIYNNQGESLSCHYLMYY